MQNIPYRINDHEIRFNLLPEEVNFSEKERLFFYDCFAGRVFSKSAILNRSWICALCMDGEAGHYFPYDFLDRLFVFCSEKGIKEIFGMPNIDGSNSDCFEDAQDFYKKFFDPPLLCAFKTTEETIHKINDMDYSDLIFHTFLLFSLSQEFIVLNNVEESYQLIAGKKEVVEFLIEKPFKDSWAVLDEEWSYHPSYGYNDLRQFAKDLGYFDGLVSKLS